MLGRQLLMLRAGCCGVLAAAMACGQPERDTRVDTPAPPAADPDPAAAPAAPAAAPAAPQSALLDRAPVAGAPVHIEVPAVLSGPLDPGEARSVLIRIQGTLTRCYAGVKQQHPTLSGRMVAEFQINTDGSVREVYMPESALTNEAGRYTDTALERCVALPLIRSRFPATEADSVFRVGLTFGEG